MNAFFEMVCAVLLALVVGFLIGSAVGRESISKDCKQLGGFYVGSSTFKCAEVK